MTTDIRSCLKLFSWARAQHRLRFSGKQAGFCAAAKLIAEETGVEEAKVRAVLAGGFSSADTQRRVAEWNDLKRSTKHDVPVLVPDPEAVFHPSEINDDWPVPISPEEALRPRSGRAGFERGDVMTRQLNRKQLGDALWEARAKRNLTVRDVEAKTGVKRSVISRAERGHADGYCDRRCGVDPVPILPDRSARTC